MDSKIEFALDETVFACLIQDPEQRRQREEEVAALFRGAEQVQELSDGYAFRFPAERAWASRLLEFVLFEKECCPFFSFELVFAPQHGPLELRLCGPEGVKEMVKFIIPEGQGL